MQLKESIINVCVVLQPNKHKNAINPETKTVVDKMAYGGKQPHHLLLNINKNLFFRLRLTHWLFQAISHSAKNCGSQMMSFSPSPLSCFLLCSQNAFQPAGTNGGQLFIGAEAKLCVLLGQLEKKQVVPQHLEKHKQTR